MDLARDFQDAFNKIFDHPAVGHSVGERLVDLRQWNSHWNFELLQQDFAGLRTGYAFFIGEFLIRNYRKS